VLVEEQLKLIIHPILQIVKLPGPLGTVFSTQVAREEPPKSAKRMQLQLVVTMSVNFDH
jgi:hypothetical protein